MQSEYQLCAFVYFEFSVILLKWIIIFFRLIDYLLQSCVKLVSLYFPLVCFLTSGGTLALKGKESSFLFSKTNRHKRTKKKKEIAGSPPVPSETNQGREFRELAVVSWLPQVTRRTVDRWQQLIGKLMRSRNPAWTLLCMFGEWDRESNEVHKKRDRVRGQPCQEQMLIKQTKTQSKKTSASFPCSFSRDLVDSSM